MHPILDKYYFWVYTFQNRNEFDLNNLKIKGENSKTDKSNFNAFSNFNPKSYLKSNDKNIYFALMNKQEFTSNLLKELTDISEKASQQNIYLTFFFKINEMIFKQFKNFLNEKLFYFGKNIKSYLKSTKDIKKLITPVIESSNKAPNSPDFNSIDVAECDFIMLLEINFNSILTFFAGFECTETKDRKDLIDIIDDYVNKLRICLEEFFFDNMITVVYPNNEIKEDLLSNFRKGFIEKTIKFYENVYTYLDLEMLWEEFEKISKVIII